MRMQGSAHQIRQWHRRNPGREAQRELAYEGKLATLRARLERLQDEAAKAGADEIRAILDELNQRFPRHHFYFSQGMGAQTVWCDGGILGDEHISPLVGETRYDQYARRFPVYEYLGRQVGRMIEIAETIDEVFLAQIGDIGTSRDSQTGPT